MALALRIIAWIAALAVTGAVFTGVWVCVREPIRQWNRGHRREAALTAFAVCCGLLFLLAASQVVPQPAFSRSPSQVLSSINERTAASAPAAGQAHAINKRYKNMSQRQLLAASVIFGVPGLVLVLVPGLSTTLHSTGTGLTAAALSTTFAAVRKRRSRA